MPWQQALTLGIEPGIFKAGWFVIFQYAAGK